MLWWYEPAYPEWLFAPAVDAHTGDLASKVLVDHWGVAGCCEMADGLGTPVRYRGTIPHGVAPYLPDRVVGEHVRGRNPNADFVGRVADVRQGRLDAERRLLAA